MIKVAPFLERLVKTVYSNAFPPSALSCLSKIQPPSHQGKLQNCTGTKVCSACTEPAEQKDTFTVRERKHPPSPPAKSYFLQVLSYLLPRKSSELC